MSGREGAALGGVDPVTVLLVDDQDYFRSVMRELIQTTEGFRVVGEAASGEAALEAAEVLSPALVIMDKRMPGMGGVEACRQLTEVHPELVVMLISIEEPNEEVRGNSRAAAVVRKQDLSRKVLEDLWRQHGVRARGAAPGSPEESSPRSSCRGPARL